MTCNSLVVAVTAAFSGAFLSVVLAIVLLGPATTAYVVLAHDAPTWSSAATRLTLGNSQQANRPRNRRGVRV